MTDRPPMRWQRGSYNCIVSGEYTICKYPAIDLCPPRLVSDRFADYRVYHKQEMITEFLNYENADAAKQACEDHARARE